MITVLHHKWHNKRNSTSKNHLLIIMISYCLASWYTLFSPFPFEISVCFRHFSVLAVNFFVFRHWLVDCLDFLLQMVFFHNPPCIPEVLQFLRSRLVMAFMDTLYFSVKNDYENLCFLVMILYS